MKTKALAAIRAYSMLEQGDLVCAAVSGGADSVALLHFLRTLRQAGGISLTACHLNHSLRGEEADRDEAFVRALCRRWQVPLTVERLDVAALARQQRISEETAGRQARYALFERLHRETGCKVATAHTLSDNMETLLFRMARGTGLHGMRGIPPVRGYLCRPLIYCTRREVEGYCAGQGLVYVQDSTNLLPGYTRNRIRLELIPQFYRLNPAVDAAFLHLIQSMEESAGFLRQQAEQFLQQQAAAGQAPAALSAPAFLELHPALQREVLALLAEQQGGTLSWRQTDLCRELAARGGVSQLGGGLRFVSRGGRLWLEPMAPPAEPWELPLSLGQLAAGVLLPDGRNLLAHRPNGGEFKNFDKKSNLCLKNTLDCGKIYGNIVLRSRRPGDTFTPAGRGVTKTLKKLFNEAKIPSERRDSLAILADEAGILWIEGFGCDARAAAGPAAQSSNYITMAIEGKTK